MTGAPIRPARPADARAAADVYLRSRQAAGDLIPPAVRSDVEVREWFEGVVLREREVWVAEGAGGDVVAVMVLDGDWVDQLYVDPAWSGRGVGSTLVTVAKRRRPAGLRLWTFQSNMPAQRFYERHGFVAVERTDGSANEERAPDVRYEWRPAQC